MQKVASNNTILSESTVDNVAIDFKGNNNIVVFEKGTRFYPGSSLTFFGNNNLMYFSSNTHLYKVKVNVGHESTVYIGKNNYFNGFLNAVISERKNLIIGDEGVISFGIWIRTADPHLIYDIETKQRINGRKSVMIGDHVWLGQNSLILKGTIIGSGSILAGGSVAAGTIIESNTIYAGNPIRKIKDNVVFLGDSVHNYTDADTKQSQTITSNKYIYERKKSNINCFDCDQLLLKNKHAEDKLDIIKSNIVNNANHNRFSVSKMTFYPHRSGLFHRF